MAVQLGRSRVSACRTVEGASVDRADQSQTEWRKGQRSGVGDCLEVASKGSLVLVRDSKDPSGAVLTLSIAQWLLLCHSLQQRYGRS
ncbi:DUF397 domain-containing protein [Actinomadura sp. GC306]|nr:DUF397 domain-containing protein [Actinomadura sp. GC306]TDC59054.1 DUF397 domain-containing protein [Actinomadura sp. GC306]